MTFTADPRVDAYIDSLPAWQQDICRQVRALAHSADPEVTETVKRRIQPYFELQGNICALLAAKDHVNVFLYDGGIVPDPEGIITGGHDNKTARTVAIRPGEVINAAALIAMFRQIIANNRAGGWRRLKQQGRQPTAPGKNNHLCLLRGQRRSAAPPLRREGGRSVTASMDQARTPIRIGNASGFYGDRFAAMREMLERGDLDVLTGDYLAELTMLILGRDRLRDPGLGYARTFLRQLEDCLGLALDRGVAIVSNAGGLNPAGLATAILELAGRLGLDPKIGYVMGDDLLPRAAELGLVAPGGGQPVAANAYLGGWGIAECLRAGADVVVTGRVTDASVTVGPAAAHFGWAHDDFDALAGATAAGHVLECGAQATGGNYSFFTEIADLRHPGFPIAEIHPDGSSVITKHPGTGGAVTVGTVTAQLLYEVAGPRYAGPDVTLCLDTVRLIQNGPDRVRIVDVRGEPPPPALKVSLNAMGGYRNQVEFVLTGLDIEAKADLVRRQLAGVLPESTQWTLARTDHADGATEEQASATLRCVVRGSDPQTVGRAFSGAAVELALASYPGFHATAPPGDAQPYGVFIAAYVDRTRVEHTAVLPDGRSVPVPDPPTRPPEPADPADPAAVPAWRHDGPTRRVALGLVAGARSGDKGGDANVGVWARDEAAWPWLAGTLTTDRLRELLPEVAGLPVRRYLLPNLRAVNFVVEGLLGEGVAAAARFDPQAKGLGEWLRARYLDVPQELL